MFTVYGYNEQGRPHVLITTKSEAQARSVYREETSVGRPASLQFPDGSFFKPGPCVGYSRP